MISSTSISNCLIRPTFYDEISVKRDLRGLVNLGPISIESLKLVFAEPEHIKKAYLIYEELLGEVVKYMNSEEKNIFVNKMIKKLYGAGFFG